MSFSVGETQTMLADMVGRLLAEENEFEARRKRLQGPVPERMALWPHFAEQGVIGAAFTEEAGGFGGTMRDLAVVMELAGRHLVVEPLLAAAVCGRVLQAAGDLDRLAQVIDGSLVLAFAHTESADPFAPLATMAVEAGGQYRLTGQKLAVRHADLAAGWIVTATLDGAPACFLVASDATEAASFRLIDGSSAATLVFSQTPGVLLGGADVVADAILWSVTGLAAETVGAIAALNEATFAYLNVRKQFGVTLATFQALQHRAADMFAASEEARVLTGRAIDAIDGNAPSRFAIASAAKALADTAGRKISHEAVQLHGGMGVSDELSVSHYLHRLTAIRAECGGADIHRARYAAQSANIDVWAEQDADLTAFRAEVREFARAAMPAALAGKGEAGLEYGKDDFVLWQKLLREKGWFAAAWPEKFGGAGWALHKQLAFAQEAALNDAPPIIPYGVSMVGPVLYTFGSAEQQERHLPGILNSDVWWCQGYSEPNSGSDLASLKTTAVRDGDFYIVNGTKMWTTEAHWAEWMHCLVRTDKEVKPQRGISYLMIEMNTPGIDIRPIVTIDGQHHTNQVFLDNVRVPVGNLIGSEGQGWTMAKFLLSNERVGIADTGPKLRLLAQLKTMMAEATVLSPFAASLIRQKLADVEIQVAALCALEQDYVKMWADGGSKEGPQASVLKIRGTEILQALTEVGLELEGPYAAAHDPADLHLPSDTKLSIVQQASVMAHRYLYGRCWSIFGGTNEIQRGIIARSILG